MGVPEFLEGLIIPSLHFLSGAVMIGIVVKFWLTCGENDGKGNDVLGQLKMLSFGIFFDALDIYKKDQTVDGLLVSHP